MNILWSHRVIAKLHRGAGLLASPLAILLATMLLLATSQLLAEAAGKPTIFTEVTEAAGITWQHFSETVKDLADVLGNFANRTLRFAASNFEGKVPSGGSLGAKETKLFEDLERCFGLYSTYLEETQFRKAAAELRTIWTLGNGYLAKEAPWTEIRTDKARAALIIRTAVNLIRLFGILSAPIIPFTGEALLKSVGVNPALNAWPKGRIADQLIVIEAGAPLEPQFAFTKILPEQVTEWEKRFGGAAV